MVEKLKQMKIVNLQKKIHGLFKEAVKNAFGIENFDPEVKWTSTGNSDLSSASAVKLYNMNYGKEGWKYSSIKDVADEITKNFPKTDYLKEIRVNKLITNTNIKPKKEKEEKEKDKEKDKEKEKKKEKPQMDQYFIDFFVDDNFIESVSMDILRNNSIKIEESTFKNKKVLVDFSSPNIAKEMHVGHLRSTIIGESICRILEYLECDVMRINHVGDWGTQFGMLIAKLKEDFPNFLIDTPQLGDLEKFYVEAKSKFKDENNVEFRKKSHQNTVLLQSGDEETVKAWKFICEASRAEFNKIYKRLDIKLTECGESFYNEVIRKLIPELEEKGVLELHEGAKIMRLDGIKVPLLVVKSDGGFNYDTTDLAAVHYRLKDLKRDWVIYVIGSEQKDHMKAIFQAAKQLGIHTDKTRLDHVSFGHVLDKTGKKFSTSDGNLIKLVDLLDEARDRSKTEIINRSNENKIVYSEEEIQSNSENIGYSSVKYYDLKQTRESNYKFDYDLILDPKGNTAVYLFYNYVRINSLKRKANMSSEDILNLAKKHSIKISHEKERALLLTLITFQEVIEDVLQNLMLNKLAEYLYNVSIKFSEFFDECRILDPENPELQISRLMITELTKITMKQSFDLLGLTPVNRI